jgi:hypothetical protein
MEQWQSLSACNKAVAEPQKVSGFEGTPCTSAVYVACFMLGLLFDPDDGGDTFFRNYTALEHRTP